MRKSSVSGLESHLGYWLRFVSNHVSQAFARKVEAAGVSVAEWVVLRELYERPALASELAARLGMTRGGISKLVDRLDDKALILRTARTDDARYQTLTLTKAGQDLVPVLSALADENDAAFFGHLEKTERDHLMATLKTIVTRHALRTVPTE
jgi:DNA-binding MarR family transcriptional regulator